MSNLERAGSRVSKGTARAVVHTVGPEGVCVMARLCTAVGPVDLSHPSGHHYQADRLHAVSFDAEDNPRPEAICGLPYRPETLDLEAHWEEHPPYLEAGLFALHDQCVNIVRLGQG
jgi:hypothetical protein